MKTADATGMQGTIVKRGLEGAQDVPDLVRDVLGLLRRIHVLVIRIAALDIVPKAVVMQRGRGGYIVHCRVPGPWSICC